MKSIFALCAVITLSLFPLPASAQQSQEAQYQHDMDIVRLNDLKEIGGYIEEYKQKTGNYPIMGKAKVPVYAYLATKEQQALTIDKAELPPYKHGKVKYNDFVNILKSGLGRDITVPFDPQRAPSGRQNFYIYMVDKDRYYFAVHLYHPYPFAQKIDENWYKVEISNVAVSKPLTWTYQDLINNPDYKKAIAEPLYKPGYVEPLRKQIRDEIGF